MTRRSIASNRAALGGPANSEWAFDVELPGRLRSEVCAPVQDLNGRFVEVPPDLARAERNQAHGRRCAAGGGDLVRIRSIVRRDMPVTV